MFWVILLTLIVIIATSVLIYLNISGAFYKVQIQRGNLEPLRFLYAKYIGDYKNIGTVQKRIRELAINSGIKYEDLKMVCMFYDRPQDTDPSNQKAIVGFCTDQLPPNKKEELMEQQYLIYGESPKCQSIFITFPYKNDFLSLYFGIQKSYPILTDYVTKNQLEAEFHGSVEVYHRGLIYFHFPISNAAKLQFYQK